MNYLQFEENLENEVLCIEVGHEIIEGSNNIMLSAPHSVRQIRNGNHKHGEFRVGTLVRMLSDQTDCHVMYKTKCFDDDANYDEDCKYKKELTNYASRNGIKLLIDLHIASPKRPFSFDIGTGYGKNILYREDVVRELKLTLEDWYKDVCINHTFSGGYPHTVSSTISKALEIPAIQIEVNWRMIDTLEKLIELKGVMQEAIERMSILL